MSLEQNDSQLQQYRAQIQANINISRTPPRQLEMRDDPVSE